MKQNKRILLVDDDIIVRMPYSQALTRNGYEVLTCESAVDITSVIDRFAPHLILMDHQMPEITGADATRHLKEHPAYRHIPIVIFSSVYNIAELAAEAGADAHIAKPGFPAEVFRTIERLLVQP